MTNQNRIINVVGMVPGPDGGVQLHAENGQVFQLLIEVDDGGSPPMLILKPIGMQPVREQQKKL